MKEICEYCNENEIFYKKHKLCKSCYHRLRRTGRLYKIYDGRIKKIEKLVVKHGREFLGDFNRLNTANYWNLTTVANKYGFSREYARKIYNLIFNKPFRPARSVKVKKRNSDFTVCANNPRVKVLSYKKGSNRYKAAIYEKMFMDFCLEKNFMVSFLKESTVDMMVNNFLVDVKSCSKATLYSRAVTKKYRYVARGDQVYFADFFACFHPAEDSFFIIPNTDDLKPDKNETISIYINEKKSKYPNAKNKYWEFNDAWHLL